MGNDIRGYDPNGDPIDEDRLQGMFDESLSELYGDVEIGGLSYDHGRVMREVDPIAYRCGLNDYWDSLMGDGYTEDEPEGGSEEDD